MSAQPGPPRTIITPVDRRYTSVALYSKACAAWEWAFYTLPFDLAIALLWPLGAPRWDFIFLLAAISALGGMQYSISRSISKMRRSLITASRVDLGKIFLTLALVSGGLVAAKLFGALQGPGMLSAAIGVLAAGIGVVVVFESLKSSKRMQDLLRRDPLRVIELWNIQVFLSVVVPLLAGRSLMVAMLVSKSSQSAPIAFEEVVALWLTVALLVGMNKPRRRLFIASCAGCRREISITLDAFRCCTFCRPELFVTARMKGDGGR